MRFNRLFVIVYIPVFLFYLSCESEKGTPLDCDKACNKDLECQNIEEKELQDCKDQCKKAVESGYLQTEFLKAIDKCFNEKCEEIESCQEDASNKCSPPHTKKLAETLCNKKIECKATTQTKEDCVSEEVSQSDDLKCLTQKFIDALEGCISKVACTSMGEDFIKCVEEMGSPID